MPYLLVDDRRFPLKSGMNFLGRDPICNIFVPDPHISRKHASLDLVSDGTMTLMDLGSTNGVVVNGQRVPSAILQPGDVFVMGQTTFKVAKDAAPKGPNAGSDSAVVPKDVRADDPGEAVDSKSSL